MNTASEIALIHIDMKSRWAQEHFDALEREADKWIKLPPFTVRREDDLKNVLQVWRIEIGLTPESIPKALGDWVCCLRSALDQLAWQMARVLAPGRTFSEREERNISFLIFKDDNSTTGIGVVCFPPQWQMLSTRFSHILEGMPTGMIPSGS